MIRFSITCVFMVFFYSLVSHGAKIPPHKGLLRSSHLRSPGSAGEDLQKLRIKILAAEKEMIEDLKGREMARIQLKRLRHLLSLHKKEALLSAKRKLELEYLIHEVERQQENYWERIVQKEAALNRTLIQIHLARRDRARPLSDMDSEALEAPRRMVLDRLVGFGVLQLEELNADRQDAARLARKIQTEKEELSYVMAEQKERKELLKFHKSLQVDILKSNYQRRLIQLERYQSLKASQQRLENLLGRFNARREFERVEEAERKAVKETLLGNFLELKGKLPLPVVGKVSHKFGRAFDPYLKLNIFRKGIQIKGQRNSSVKAIASGKVVYSGPLKGYGNVVILDHGANYYSLVARLGNINRKSGEWVGPGDVLGQSRLDGSPVYFEIRSRNVAVDPLDWVDRRKI